MAIELEDMGTNTLKVARHYLQTRISATHNRMLQAMRQGDVSREVALTQIMSHLAREHALVAQELDAREGQE